MKNLLFILLLFPAFAFAQDAPKLPLNKSGIIEYTEVVQVDSVDAKMLYSRARLFVANAFNSATDVTKLEDENTATVVTKGFLPRNYTYPLNRDFGGAVSFSFTIQCKDGRYKYMVTDFVHHDRLKPGYSGGALERDKPACGGLHMNRKMWTQIKSETAGHIDRFVRVLKSSMKGATAFSANDNW